MPYETEIVTENESREMYEKYAKSCLFNAKADINGICVLLCTADRDHIDMWRDNFYAMSDRVRSHAMLYCVKDPKIQGCVVRFDPDTCTAFLFNFEYYGWVKSIALGIAGYILEGTHGVYSVHGAAVSFGDRGVTIIAPSKTGKTTQSWGLLRDKGTCLISDDWFFVTFGSGRPMMSGSEKNCYIDSDIGDVWEEYKPLVKNVKFDGNGRGIANVRWIAGESSVIQSAPLGTVFLLEREPADPDTIRELTSHDALEYLLNNDLCNPHQIVRDPYRGKLRADFFKRMFDECTVYMVNTVGTPEETQKAIRNALERCRDGIEARSFQQGKRYRASEDP